MRNHFQLRKLKDASLHQAIFGQLSDSLLMPMLSLCWSSFNNSVTAAVNDSIQSSKVVHEKLCELNIR